MLKNKMTAVSPVGAGGQSNHIKSNDIISENAQKCNGFGENIFIKVKSAVDMAAMAHTERRFVNGIKAKLRCARVG